MTSPSNSLILTDLLLTERPSLFKRLCAVLRGDRYAAEDVLQELWLKLQNVRDYPPIENPRAYLYRIAMNAALDSLRDSTRRGKMVATEITDILWVEDDRPGPDRLTIDRDMLDQIVTAIEGLPEPTRSMFRLNRFEGFTQKEIAQRYGVSTTIIERHIRHALNALNVVRSD